MKSTIWKTLFVWSPEAICSLATSDPPPPPRFTKHAFFPWNCRESPKNALPYEMQKIELVIFWGKVTVIRKA